MRLGVVCGLASERDALALPPRIPVLVSAARPEAAEAAAAQLLATGADALLSIGLAGGLDPALRPGQPFVPAHILDTDGTRHPASAALAVSLGLALSPGTLAGADQVVASPGEKARLRSATGALAVDMESHRVARVAARHRLPFLAIRAIADPAEGAIPACTRHSIREDGTVDVLATLGALIRRPADLPALIHLGRHSARAHQRLGELGRQLAARALPPPRS